MKPSQLNIALKTLIHIKQPVFIWGPPGVGKSQVVSQTTQQMGLNLIDVRAVLLDPVDLRGLPYIDKNQRVCWSPPDFLPKKGSGILFLDELNAAPPLVQAACYQLILDRKLGEYQLPEDWSIIAAGNRETDRSVTHRISSALANRFVHLKFDVNLEDWLNWAKKNNQSEEVIAFLKFRPALLHAFDPQKNEKAFPTPRSWEFVSHILSGRPDKALEFELIAGTVGEGAAAEFSGFSRIYRNLPNPDMLLSSPEASEVPEDPATLYAVCEVLASKANKQNMAQIIAYANRLPPEYSVLLVRDAVKTDKGIVDTEAFNEWAATYSEVLI